VSYTPVCSQADSWQTFRDLNQWAAVRSGDDRAGALTNPGKKKPPRLDNAG